MVRNSVALALASPFLPPFSIIDVPHIGHLHLPPIISPIRYPGDLTVLKASQMPTNAPTKGSIKVKGIGV